MVISLWNFSKLHLYEVRVFFHVLFSPEMKNKKQKLLTYQWISRHSLFPVQDSWAWRFSQIVCLFSSSFAKIPRFLQVTILTFLLVDTLRYCSNWKLQPDLQLMYILGQEWKLTVLFSDQRTRDRAISLVNRINTSIMPMLQVDWLRFAAMH